MAWLCKQLGVARSGFYSWRQRQHNPGRRALENAALTAQVQAVFEQHRGFIRSSWPQASRWAGTVSPG